VVHALKLNAKLRSYESQFRGWLDLAGSRNRMYRRFTHLVKHPVGSITPKPFESRLVTTLNEFTLEP